MLLFSGPRGSCAAGILRQNDFHLFWGEKPKESGWGQPWLVGDPKAESHTQMALCPGGDTGLERGLPSKGSCCHVGMQARCCRFFFFP